MAPALRDDRDAGRGERCGTNAQMINVLIMFKGSFFNLIPTESCKSTEFDALGHLEILVRNNSKLSTPNHS